jgi:hypothetical protein
MKNRKSKTVRILAAVVLACPVALAIGCSPSAITLASFLSFSAGWIGASQVVNVDTKCYSNGLLVDCSTLNESTD